MRILIVEDEKKIAGFLKKGLEEENYSVDIVYDGMEAIEFARQTDYDCILLDILLPSANGIQICRELRRSKTDSPILMLTALGTTEDKVLGLNSGADDYLAKPFEFEELLARVRSLIRRKSGMLESTLKIDDLIMRLNTRRVYRGEKLVELTNREFAVLEYLMQNQGRVITRTMLLEHVWDYSYDIGSNVVDVHINLLRNKIDKGYKNQLIKTVRGAGYMLALDRDD